MPYRSFLLLFLCFPFSLFCDADGALREAARNFESGDFEQALESYHKLLETPLTPWQEAVVQYNIGCTLLAQGKTQRAIEQFQSIPLGKDPHPLLLRRIQTNVALAYIRQAQRFAPDTLDKAVKSIFSYQEALSAVYAALQADCVLETAEGASHCAPPSDLLDMQTLVKVELAKVYAHLEKLRDQQTSLKDQAPFLLMTLRELIRATHFLQNKQLQGDLRQQYLNLMLEMATTRKSSWRSVATKIKQEPQELQQLYFSGQSKFEQGLRALKSGDFATTKMAWDSAKRIIEDIIKKSLGADPTQEILHKLLAFYDFAYAQIPLQESTLLSLEEEQKQVTSTLQAPLQKSMNVAQEEIAKSLQAFRKLNSFKARFYLEQGRDAVSTLVRQLRLVSLNPPLEMIEDLLADQRHALTVNNLRRTVENEGDTALVDAVTIAQNKVVETASAFMPLVLAWQEKEFQQPPGSEERCQHNPWDEALPLFSAGVQSAKQALPINASAAIRYQEDALAKWERVRQLLSQPKTAFQGSCQSRPQEAKAQQGKQPQEQPQASMSDIVRTLVEMDQQDHLPPTEPAVSGGGVNPW